MEYKTFKEGIRKELQERLGEGTEISFHDLERNNGRKVEGLEVREKGSPAAPVLHLDELYWVYCCSGSMEETAIHALGLLERKPPASARAVPRTWAAARGRIRAVLVHYNWNRKRLAQDPHRRFLNHAVTYRMELTEPGGYQAGTGINSGLMEAWGATEGMLYQAAMENMENEPYSIQPVEGLLGKMAGILPGRMPEAPEGRKQPYVLMNGCCYGAAGMLRQDLMEEFAEQEGGSFYILPSSIHDLILLPDDPSVSVDCLKEMVKEVNETTVAREEWLSEDVYYYDSVEKKVRIA